MGAVAGNRQAHEEKRRINAHSELPVIDSSGGIGGVKRALESNDVAFEASGSRIKFSFKNRGRIDGIDFVVGCSNRFTVSASVNGAPIANNRVFLGSGSVNPTSVPFVLERS